MKKLLACLLVALVCVGAAGCGRSEKADEKEALMAQYQQSLDALKTQKAAIDKTVAALQGQSNAVGAQIQSLEAVYAGLNEVKKPTFWGTYWFVFLILLPVIGWLGYNIWRKRKNMM